MGKSSLFVRSFSTWALLVVFLLSCTAQPPVVKQATSPLPSASPFWLPPPQASHPVIGKALRPAPKPIQASNQGFQIKGSSSTESRQCLYLDTTNTGGSILASITGTINANVTMSEGILYPYSFPDRNFRIGNINIRQPTTGTYSTGMSIPELVFPDKILEPNRNYVFPLPSGTVLSFNDSHHFLGGATGSIAFNTTSSGASLTISGSILKGSNYPGDPFTYAKAELSGTLQYSGSMSTCVPAITLASNIDTVDLGSTDTNLNQAQFTITPENKTKAWTLNITGPNNFSQNYQGTGNNNTFTLGGNIPTGPYTAALFYDDLPSYKAVLNLTVVRNDSLDLTLSQSLLVPNGAPSSADAQVTVSNPSRPWELLLQRTGPANGCNADQQSFGPFTGNQTIPISSTGLPDGEYALTARYTDDPNSAKIANFNISSLLKLTPSATELPYGSSVSFSVQAPLCPGWKLFVDSEECTLSTGSGNTEGITWDGTCNGNRVGPFPHSVQLVAGDKTDSATIQVSNLTFPTPTPTATPCVGNSCQPCPAGEVCPPEPTAPPPGPTAPPPPCPDGVCSPCSGPFCGPQICPVGQLCASLPREPRPNDSPKPPTPPTATPTPGEGFCPVSNDAQQVQDSGYKIAAQLPETFQDTQELNQTLQAWNQIQNQLNPGGFTTASTKEHEKEHKEKPENESKDSHVQAKLDEINQRFLRLYWNVRDELGYLEPMRQTLASVLYAQTGSLPTVTLSSNLHAQAIGYEHRWNEHKDELNGLEGLEILYAELQTYLWATQLFIEQNNPSQSAIEGLHKLQLLITQHSEYLAQKPNLLDNDHSLILKDIHQMGNIAVQALDTLIANIEPDGFRTQAGNNLIQVPKEIANGLIQLQKSVKTATASGEAIVSNAARKQAISSGIITARTLQGTLSKASFRGAGALLAGVNLALPILFLTDALLDIGKNIYECINIGIYMKNMEDALAEMLPLMNQLFTQQCLLNGDGKKLIQIANHLNQELTVVQNNLNAILQAAAKENKNALKNASERYTKNIQNFRKVQIPQAQKQAQQECSDECGNEIQALTDYYNTIPTNIVIPNPNPTAKPAPPGVPIRADAMYDNEFVEKALTKEASFSTNIQNSKICS